MYVVTTERPMVGFVGSIIQGKVNYFYGRTGMVKEGTFCLGLRTVPSDGYSRTFDGQGTGTADPYQSVMSAHWIPDGYGTGTGTAVVR
jgi:hypothetical protein